jgi:hypothetical protein
METRNIGDTHVVFYGELAVVILDTKCKIYGRNDVSKLVQKYALQRTDILRLAS